MIRITHPLHQRDTSKSHHRPNHRHHSKLNHANRPNHNRFGLGFVKFGVSSIPSNRQPDATNRSSTYRSASPPSRKSCPCAEAWTVKIVALLFVSTLRAYIVNRKS